jgi:hypothetical protein
MLGKNPNVAKKFVSNAIHYIKSLPNVPVGDRSPSMECASSALVQLGHQKRGLNAVTARSCTTKHASRTNTKSTYQTTLMMTFSCVMAVLQLNITLMMIMIQVFVKG